MKIGKSTLILGGSRSGKTAYALGICEALQDHSLIYLATAPNTDQEMDKRIKNHKAERGSKWQTIENETNIANIINANNAPDICIMIDCLTLWLNNIIYHNLDLQKSKAELLNAINNHKGILVFVSNELGQGIVPDNASARNFRDEQGWLNQEIAKACDKVYFIIAGLKQKLK